MSLYSIYPILAGEPEFPLSEPVPLKTALRLIEQRMELLAVQGYWRNCRCEQIPLNQIGFEIRPENNTEDI
jgi:hypothetical protein